MQKIGHFPLVCHFKLGSDGLSETEMEKMKNVPYTFVVGSLMYVIICIWHDITSVGVVSMYLANLSVGK